MPPTWDTVSYCCPKSTVRKNSEPNTGSTIYLDSDAATGKIIDGPTAVSCLLSEKRVNN
jgi:hypothetical protein